MLSVDDHSSRGKPSHAGHCVFLFCAASSDISKYSSQVHTRDGAATAPASLRRARAPKPVTFLHRRPGRRRPVCRLCFPSTNSDPDRAKYYH